MWHFKKFQMIWILFVLTLFPCLLPSASALTFKEASFHSLGLSANAGGLAILGARVKLSDLEFTAAWHQVHWLLGGAAFRFDLNEDGFLMPHISLGLPMTGVGLNLRIIKLFGVRLGVRFDNYVLIDVTTLQLEPYFTLGIALGF
jgi:hypothetical protein